jgi:uncharacterized Tic20 family protein
VAFGLVFVLTRGITLRFFIQERNMDPEQVTLTGLQRVAIAFSHAGFFLAMPFLLPLAIWFLFPTFFEDTGGQVKEQSLRAMLFHLIVVIVSAVLWGVTYALFAIVIIGWPFAAVTGILALAFSVWSTIVILIAVIKSASGEIYHLPFVGGAVAGIRASDS